VTGRVEIRRAAGGLAARASDGSFALAADLYDPRNRGTRYAESTIRTHVKSMCANACDRHAVTRDALVRVRQGRRRTRR
jgi:hypothetical protein